MFAVGSAIGRQFAIILGNTDTTTGRHPAEQTRLVLEKCVLPRIAGIQEVVDVYQGSQVKRKISKLYPSNQTSCLVESQTALIDLLRWYAGSVVSAMPSTRGNSAQPTAENDATVVASPTTHIPAITEPAFQQLVQEFQRAPSVTEEQRQITVRVGQDVFRSYQLRMWDGACAISNMQWLDLLRASHIKPWAACESDAERLNRYNGLMLAAHWDALFDKGWISFDDTGRLLWSPQVPAQLRVQLGEAKESIALQPQHLPFMKWHRTHIFQAA